jgi:glycosyltransferase involved in cell wall biosynthesis
MYSVVVTTMGSSPYLWAAVDSIHKQTVLPEKVIIVVDGNRADTNLSHFCNETTDVIYTGINKGANYARTIGLSKVETKYVMFLDDDDVWLPMKSERQIKYLETFPNCPAVSCNRGILIGNSVKSHTHFTERYARDRLHLDNIFGSFSFVCFRKSALPVHSPFDLSLKAFQDYDLYFRLKAKGEMMLLKEELALYRIHNDVSRISNNWAKVSDAQLMFLSKHIKCLSLRESIYHLGRAVVYDSNSSKTFEACILGFWGLVLMILSLKANSRTFYNIFKTFITTHFSF